MSTRPQPAWQNNIPKRVKGRTTPGAVLALIILLDTAILLVSALREPLWYDELLTLYTSSLHPISLLWQALREGIDSMPFGFYAMVLAARSIPADPHLTLRLVSVVGYVLCLSGTYWFLSKHVSRSSGLVAALIIALSRFREYGIEARAYSILVGLLAISAALWQRVDEKRWAAPCLAITLTLATCSHYLAVVTLVSIAIPEIAYTVISRRIRWTVWAALLAALLPFFLYLPLLLNFKLIFGSTFWAKSTWGTTIGTYKGLYGLDTNFALALVLFILLALFGLAKNVWRRLPGDDERDSLPLPTTLLVASFLVYPALLVVLMKLQHSGYTDRYGFPGILGLAWGIALLFHARAPEWSRTAIIGALLLAFGFQAVRETRGVLSSQPVRGAQVERLGELLQIGVQNPEVPIVIANGGEYVELNHYATPEWRTRLFELADPAAAARLSGTDSLERANLILSRFVPLQVADAAPFLAMHKRFLVRSRNHAWLLPYLGEHGYKLQLLSSVSENEIYMAER